MRCGLEHCNRHLDWSPLYFHDSVDLSLVRVYFSIVFSGSRTFLNPVRRGHGVTVPISDQSTVQLESQAENYSGSRERRRVPPEPMGMHQRQRSAETRSVGSRARSFRNSLEHCPQDTPKPARGGSEAEYCY